MLREPISMPASLIKTPVVPGIRNGLVCNYLEVLTRYNDKVKLIYPMPPEYTIAITDLCYSQAQWDETIFLIAGLSVKRIPET